MHFNLTFQLRGHHQSIYNPLILQYNRDASLQGQSLKLSAQPGCYSTDLGNTEEWAKGEVGIVVTEDGDDVTMPGITQLVFPDR